MMEIQITTNERQVITSQQAWHYGIIPKRSNGTSFTFYVDADKNQDEIKEELEFIMGRSITLEPVSHESIVNALSRYYQKDKKQKNNSNIGQINVKSNDFIVDLITEANNIGSSDIHFEVFENKCRVRFRIDGQLNERYILNKDEYPALVNKIKIKANLDIAEKRLPQDGRIYYQQFESKFDIRVSALPTLYGEKIVLRLLSKDATSIELVSLGFTSRQLEEYRNNIKKPHGIVLISGPTGSGKTTTLYASLKLLNKENVNILTINILSGKPNLY